MYLGRVLWVIVVVGVVFECCVCVCMGDIDVSNVICVGVLCVDDVCIVDMDVLNVSCVGVLCCICVLGGVGVLCGVGVFVADGGWLVALHCDCVDGWLAM